MAQWLTGKGRARFGYETATELHSPKLTPYSLRASSIQP